MVLLTCLLQTLYSFEMKISKILRLEQDWPFLFKVNSVLLYMNFAYVSGTINPALYILIKLLTEISTACLVDMRKQNMHTDYHEYLCVWFSSTEVPLDYWFALFTVVYLCPCVLSALLYSQCLANSSHAINICEIMRK